MFLNVSTQQLLLSMEGTKNCLYCRESSKYDTAVKKDIRWLNLVQ